MGLFGRRKPKGKMYSLKCTQCGEGFLSSYPLEVPICSKCIQNAKSLDSTIEHEKICAGCGNPGVIYGKEYCHSCYFGFGKNRKEEHGSGSSESAESSRTSSHSSGKRHPYG